MNVEILEISASRGQLLVRRSPPVQNAVCEISSGESKMHLGG